MVKTIDKIVRGDRTIIIIVATLMLLSALMMGSTLTKMALDNTNFNFSYLIRQLFFSGIAFTMMIILSQTPYQIYSKLARNILIIAGILVILTIIFGEEVNGAKRWLRVPFLGLKFQTSDFVRLALVIYTAKIISEFDFEKGDIKELLKKSLIPTLSLIFLSALSDLSTAGLMYITIFAMIFVTPINKKYFFKIFGIISGAALALFIFAVVTGSARGGTWENRLKSDNGGFSQKLQAQIAISNGGILIKPGKSEQKYVLPNSYSDYVFSIAVEEYGIWGVTLIIGLYIIFMYRIATILKRQKRSFPMFLALGIALNILFQAFMHIVVNVGIVPVTGQPLPLVSHGGTAMIVTAAQIGIILNISQIGTSEERIKPERIDEINATEEELAEIETQIETEPEVEIEINDYPFLIG